MNCTPVFGVLGFDYRISTVNETPRWYAHAQTCEASRIWCISKKPDDHDWLFQIVMARTPGIFTHFVKSCIHNCFHRCHIEMDAAEVNFNNLGKTYPNTVCTKDTLSIVQCDRVHAECLWRPLSLSTFPEFRSGRCSKELFLRKLRTTWKKKGHHHHLDGRHQRDLLVSLGQHLDCCADLNIPSTAREWVRDLVSKMEAAWGNSHVLISKPVPYHNAR